MNIFSTMQQTPYRFSKKTSDNTWTGANQTIGYDGWGVWKPRGTSTLPIESPDQTGQPTLNIKPSERFIDHSNPDAMIGSVVVVPSVGGKSYLVTGVTTAKNFRTKRVEHYRLLLQETTTK